MVFWDPMLVKMAEDEHLSSAGTAPETATGATALNHATVYPVAHLRVATEFILYTSYREINVKKTLSVSPMLRPIMSETSKTAKIILVLYWTMDLI